MHLFLKLHQLAAERGDGLRPEWVEVLTRTTCADQTIKGAVALSVVQPGNHPDGVSVVPPGERDLAGTQVPRKAFG